MGMPGGITSIPRRLQERNYTISGVTQADTGLALGTCVVKLFNAATDLLEQQTTSNAAGAYSFTVDKNQSYYEVAYKAGATDVYGTTINTVRGA